MVGPELVLCNSTTDIKDLEGGMLCLAVRIKGSRINIEKTLVYRKGHNLHL
jgi:hypothetical protein